MVGLLAPDSHTGATLTVHGLDHEDADSQVLRQRQGASSSRQGRTQQGRTGPADGGQADGASLMRVSRSVVLVEAWQIVEEAQQQLLELKQKQQEAATAAAAALSSSSSSNSSSGTRPGERSLQQAIVTDLPSTDPRQCIFPE